jgi:hypothetical protein
MPEIAAFEIRDDNGLDHVSVGVARMVMLLHWLVFATISSLLIPDI